MKVLCVLLVVIVVAATKEQCQTDGCPKIPKNCGPHKRCLEEINNNVTQHIPYPDDCHKFYKCAEGEAYLLCCPLIDPNGSKRLVFNPELQVCDWPHNVENPEAKCDNVNPTEPTTKPTTTPTKPTITTTEPTTTITESTTTTTEPTTTTTEPITTTTESTTEPITLPPNKDCGTNETKLIAYEPDCTKYYRCTNGIKSGPYSCYQGHVFNPKIGSCDSPDNYNCPHSTSNVEYFDN